MEISFSSLDQWLSRSTTDSCNDTRSSLADCSRWPSLRNTVSSQDASGLNCMIARRMCISSSKRYTMACECRVFLLLVRADETVWTGTSRHPTHTTFRRSARFCVYRRNTSLNTSVSTALQGLTSTGHPPSQDGTNVKRQRLNKGNTHLIRSGPTPSSLSASR